MISGDVTHVFVVTTGFVVNQIVITSLKSDVDMYVHQGINHIQLHGVLLMILQYIMFMYMCTGAMLYLRINTSRSKCQSVVQ